MKITKKELLNIPNIISLIRILLIPIILILYFNDKTILAAVVLLISGLTDTVDGFVARHFDQITEIGKMLDPVADKLTQAAVLLMLSVTYAQIVPVVIIVIGKEMLMILGGVKLLKDGKKPAAANYWGKISTFIFYAVMIAIISFGKYFSNELITGLMVMVTIFVLFAFINYLEIYIRINKED